MLPAALLLLFTRKRLRLKLLSCVLAALTMAGVPAVSGCGNSLSVNSTPPGSYTFQITGVGNASGASQATAVQLTVTR